MDDSNAKLPDSPPRKTRWRRVAIGIGILLAVSVLAITFLGRQANRCFRRGNWNLNSMSSAEMKKLNDHTVGYWDGKVCRFPDGTTDY